MKKLIIYTYKENQPKIGQRVLRIIKDWRGETHITQDMLENTYPKIRLSNKTKYPEPIVMWLNGSEPKDNDEWGYYEYEKDIITTEIYNCTIENIFTYIIDVICFERGFISIEKCEFPDNLELKKGVPFIYTIERNSKGEVINKKIEMKDWN